MIRHELHDELKKVLYIENTNLVDTMLASVIANSQKIGDPVWLTIIGPSSGGKSQYIRPLAKANPELFLQIDDLTANTFISGNGEAQSLIFKIKKGASRIISMDDLTVLFSKNAEDRNAILAQFRMIYDGRMTKASGKSNGKGITWEGHAGMIAGSTPAIYRHFSEVADMGERFINYRMKDLNEDKAVDFIMGNPMAARDMDEKIKLAYGKYFSAIMPKVEELKGKNIPVDDKTMQAIIDISKAGTKLRTPVITDDREHFVSEFPISEMPFRAMKQLTNVARSFQAMHYAETGETVLPTDLRTAIEWIGYSLADDKRRAYFNAVIGLEAQMLKPTARNISAYTGLHHTAVERGMSVLSAIGVVKMSEAKEGENQTRTWSVTDHRLKEIVKRIDPPKKVEQDDYQDDGKEGA